MSLRRDIHQALDVIAPSTGGMAERVVETARAEAPVRKSGDGFMLHVRAPISLVAAVLLVAIVVAVVLGTRLASNFVSPVGVGQSQLDRLAARPLQQPVLQPGDPCPDGPRNSNGVYGAGPAYVLGTPGAYPPGVRTTPWGTYWDGDLSMDSGVKGTVIVRARDLRTGQPAVFVGRNAGGPVVGTDTIDGKSVQQHLYLVLDAAHPEITEAIWTFSVGLARGTSYCTGWQVDGADFTERWEGPRADV